MWIDIGLAADFTRRPLTRAMVSGAVVVITHQDGRFGALAGTCNHAGGPLAEGHLDGEFVVCPWHHWKFHCRTGLGEPGFEADAVPRYDVKVDGGRLFVSEAPVSPRTYAEHPPQPLAREVIRAPGPVRVLGISTTNMDIAYPRYSTSDALLVVAMEQAGQLNAETQTIRLADLSFRACEGYYSKSAHACTWPCSITQMDPADQMARVYEAFVHWADVVLVATPIRWGILGYARIAREAVMPAIQRSRNSVLQALASREEPLP